ncbi:hypothetical protein [Methanolobus vulcani]|uniref:hypothetical protein n=1 Tax=Methanolobus vulcani TaxID=38026 RepID=UPI0018AC8EFE|nr:hypothetical protein [Methanolobus vulcani]
MSLFMRNALCFYIVFIFQTITLCKSNYYSENSYRIIQKAAAKSWQAAAWWLERSCPTEFAKRDVEINMTQNNVEINIDETREKINGRINSIAARVRVAEDPE